VGSRLHAPGSPPENLLVVTNRTGATVGAVTVARGVALVVAVIMIFYFATSDAIRADNAFLVPDLALTAFLLGTAFLRGRLAVPAMLFSFAWAAGVFTVAWFEYVVRDEYPIAHPALIAGCLVAAGLLTREIVRSKA
jgi:hypothetical protein